MRLVAQALLAKCSGQFGLDAGTLGPERGLARLFASGNIWCSRQSLEVIGSEDNPLAEDRTGSQRGAPSAICAQSRLGHQTRVADSAKRHYGATALLDHIETRSLEIESQYIHDTLE